MDEVLVPVAPSVFTAQRGSAPKRESMSLFERLNAEKGLQLPFFGTPVHGESARTLSFGSRGSG